MYVLQKNDPLNIKDFKYVIIDTDCGGDDAQALILIDYYVRKQQKTLLGITCCDGNASIDDVIKNILIVQSVCGSNYPIYPGIESSIAGQTLKDYFFGKDGLGQTQSHYLQTLKLNYGLVHKQKAYKFIADSAIKYKGQIALICIGPLSNLALAYHYNNQISKCFTNVSIMGCSDTLAGVHQFYTSQFNIGLDPQAGFVLFEKFNNIIVCTFDTSIFSVNNSVTKKLFVTTNTPKAELVKRIHQYHFKKPIVPSVVDPLAILVLFKPDVVKCGANIRFKIQIKGHRTRGCSMIDYFSPDSHHPNAYLVKQLDEQKIVAQIQQSYV